MEKITYASLGSLGEPFHKSFDEAWAGLSPQLGKTFPIHIGGKPVKVGESYSTHAPFDRKLEIARFQTADQSHAIRAIAAAKKAHPSWRDTHWQARVRLLQRAAAILIERQFHAAAVVSMETGKSRFEAIAEVSEAIDLILYYCNQMIGHHGYVTPMKAGGGERSQSVLKPYGVWSVIAPFNFPIALLTGMASAALIAGNTVVIKPASDTAWSGYLFFEALLEAGLPAGVANFITGPGKTVGKELTTNSDVDGLVFTGSRAVGMSLVKNFSQNYPKPCIVEMGGKNAAIVMPSANMDDAVEGVVRSAFGMAGQKCSACSRLYVHKDIYKPFMEALVERTKKLVIGPPTDRDAFVSPLIGADAVKRYRSALRLAQKEGRVLVGGSPLESGLKNGFYAQPVIVDSLPASSRLFVDELFAPVLAAAKVSSLEQAITLANQSDYGLTAGVFTHDLDEQQLFFKTIQAGVTYGNRRGGATTGAWPGVQSFGGWRGSGSSGKSALGPWYVPQFMREQSQTLKRR